MSSRQKTLVPNALTLSNLLCGLLALMTLIAGWPLTWTAGLLAAALLCDLLDGRAARMLGVSSPVGAMLDSLADLVSFCVVPAAVLYVWGFHGSGALGLIAACALVAAGAWRLARFTVAAAEPPPKETDTPKRGVFAGLPVTMPAAIITGAAGVGVTLAPLTLLGIALALAGLMVSHIEFRSFKEVSVGILAVPAAILTVAAMVATQGIAVGLSAAIALIGLSFAVSGPALAVGRRIRRVAV